MADFGRDRIAGMSASEFVALVKSTSDKDIDAVMAGPDRGAILDEVFNRFPSMFLADKAKGVDARINFRVTGGPDDSSDTYAVVVKDDACTIEKSPTQEPTVSLMSGPADFFKLITNTGNPVMMAMMGKLKVRGDLGLAQRFSAFFDA